jgi:hypothetical protein
MNMTFSIKEHLGRMSIGEALCFKNVCIFPVFSELEEKTSYLSLPRALKDELLRVTEVGHGGSVPELLVENMSDSPVLMLDGEELMGAKQNRVLNTTVLIKEHSRTEIPVSCTEQGRWSYNSDHFADSGVVMARTARLTKNRFVASSLDEDQSFDSHQGEVWYEIHQMSSKRGVRSETSAMRDVFENSREELESYLQHFPLKEGQKGLIACINGNVGGMDYVSSAGAFADLYQKLLKSYIMDALVEKTKKEKEVSLKTAQNFLSSITDTEGSVHPSVSLGEDHRYRGDKLMASALVHKEEIIHLAAFAIENGDMSYKTGQDMAGLRRRKGFRDDFVIM